MELLARLRNSIRFMVALLLQVGQVEGSKASAVNKLFLKAVSREVK